MLWVIEQSLILFSFHEEQFGIFSSSLWFLEMLQNSPRSSEKCFLNGCFCQWSDPPVYRCFRDLFWRSAWDDPLFPSPVNMTLSLTPSRTMPPHVPGCGRATHSSLVPRTLPIASPWLSLRGCWVVLISIAWYMRVEGEYGGQKVQRGAFVSWG